MNRLFTTNILFCIYQRSGTVLLNSLVGFSESTIVVKYLLEKSIFKSPIVHVPLPLGSAYTENYFGECQLYVGNREQYINLLLRAQKLCSNTNYKLPLKT